MSTKQCVNCPGAVDHTTAECPISPERAASSLLAAGSAELPEPDFALDGGSQPCYYAETVQRIVAALSAQQSAHVSVPRELLERITRRFSIRPHWDSMQQGAAIAELRALLDGGEA